MGNVCVKSNTTEVLAKKAVPRSAGIAAAKSSNLDIVIEGNMDLLDSYDEADYQNHEEGDDENDQLAADSNHPVKDNTLGTSLHQRQRNAGRTNSNKAKKHIGRKAGPTIEIEPCTETEPSDYSDDDDSEDGEVQPLATLIEVAKKDEIEKIQKMGAARPMSSDMAEIKRKSKLAFRPTSTAARLSKGIKLEVNQNGADGVGDMDSNAGNMLNEMDHDSRGISGMLKANQVLSGVQGVVATDDLFANLGEDVLKELIDGFQVAKSRAFHSSTADDYVSASQQAETSGKYKTAPFYMSGSCHEKLIDGKKYVVHGYLSQQLWSKEMKQLSDQIVIEDDDANFDLSLAENVATFLSKHSKLVGKHIKEVQEISQGLTHTTYKIVGSSAATEDEIAIMVPKKPTNYTNLPLHDLIYETQLGQLLNQRAKRHVSLGAREEIFVLSPQSGTILNYVAIVDHSSMTLIDMLDGPLAGTGFQNNAADMDEDGYRSQEIFTQEKYCYLLWKAVLLLEYLFDNKISHGQINANSLRISDTYALTLSNLSLASDTEPPGFYKPSTSSALIEHFQTEGHMSKEQLMREDQRCMAKAFYLPLQAQAQSITDDAIRDFVSNTSHELIQAKEAAGHVKLLAAKANKFMVEQPQVFTVLLETLADEQMTDAVDAIADEINTLGAQMDSPRLQALALLTLGELKSRNFTSDDGEESTANTQEAIGRLESAYQLYQQDSSILSGEEYSRLCLALSTLYRTAMKDLAKAKRWLELAQDSITDKRVLMTFFTESASIFTAENKYHQALDCQKKAIDLARQLYREDDYAFFEMQISLAEAMERCGDKDEAQAVLTECFTAMDGRDGASVYSRGMSIRSKLSRAISIRSKGTSLVMYGKHRISGQSIDFAGVQASREKAVAMERVAVHLRQKQEYERATRLLHKAIRAKKQIANTEISDEVAYLYSELAVTYHSMQDLESAAKCTKKQLAIWDELDESRCETVEYVQSLLFLGEIWRDLEKPAEAIPVLEDAIKLHESVVVGEGDDVPSADQMALERTLYMKMLAEEYIKNGEVQNGISMAKRALELQKQLTGGGQLVQETMHLLAEVYTVSGLTEAALSMYSSLLDRSKSGQQSLSAEKDIHRKMAPLHAKHGDFTSAASCLSIVIEIETEPILKVGLLTKMAGNLKKANIQDKCVKASQDAYDLMRQLGSASSDLRTCRCLMNLASVLKFFAKNDQARALYQEYVAIYEALDTEETVDSDQAYGQLLAVAKAALEELEEATAENGGQDEYYDEEEPKDGDGDPH